MSDSVKCSSVEPEGQVESNYASRVTVLVISGRFIFTNGEESYFLTFLKQIHMLFFSKSTAKQILFEHFVEKGGFATAKLLFFALNQNQVATCCSYMNRKIPVPTSHNKRNYEVFLSSL